MSEPAFLYHEILPENNKASGYTAHENVDFNLTAQGRAIMLGSIRIEGELEVKYAGRFLNSDEDVNGVISDKSIYLNPAVGAHSCFESITTSMNGVVVETAMDYNRWVNVATRATSEQGDFGNQSDQTCELKAPYYQMTSPLLQGNVPEHQPTTELRLNPDFSVKPMIALNTSLRALPYSKSGVIRVTLNMARINQILWGKDVDGQCTYACKDLRVTFTSIPEEGVDMSPIRMRTKISMKQSIQSKLSNVALRVPGICTGVSCVFLPQAQENSLKDDALALATLPNVNSVQFAFNDATSQLISFKLKEDTTIIHNFIKSLLDTGLNTLSPTEWANSGEGYGVGVSFNGQAVDLRNQKFSVQLNADGVDAASPYVIFLYFHSFVDL